LSLIKKNEFNIPSEHHYHALSNHVQEKRGHRILGITLTHLDTVSKFLARSILILRRTKPLENLAQHYNIVMWRQCHIWRRRNILKIVTSSEWCHGHGVTWHHQ